MMEDEGDDRDDSKRKTRNLSEKKRRDQFNMLVNELNAMISTSNRKMDKSTILKSTITFLKNHNEVAVRSRVNEIQEDWKPSFLSNEEFTHLILEALDGFIMVFTSSGKINYASESITSLLGHLPGDLLNTSIYEITNDRDRPSLFSMLQKPSGFNASKCGIIEKDNQVAFSCHLKRGCLDQREGPSYELVQFTGYFRSQEDLQDSDSIYGFDHNSDSNARSIFVCTGRLQTPQLIRDMSVVDSSKSEFTSRHSLEWKFLFLDHRAPPIIGYLPFEVLGTSGYDYYHFDDLDKVVNCHEALMQKGEGTSCYYRFLTKGQQWIWLQTRFYITYHQWNSKPEFVVCTHRVVSYQDVIKSLHREPEYCNQTNASKAENNMNFENQNNARYISQNDSSTFQHNTWRKRSSKMSRHFTTLDSSGYKKNYNKRSNNVHSSNHGSDTTSISADSVASRQSSTTHQSSCSVIMHAGALSMHQQSRCLHTTHRSDIMSQHMLQTPHIPQLQQIPPQIQHQQEFQQAQQLPEQLIPQYQENPQYLAVPVPSVINLPAMQPLPVSPDIGIMVTHNQVETQGQVRFKFQCLSGFVNVN